MWFPCRGSTEIRSAATGGLSGAELRTSARSGRACPRPRAKGVHCFQSRDLAQSRDRACGPTGRKGSAARLPRFIREQGVAIDDATVASARRRREDRHRACAMAGPRSVTSPLPINPAPSSAAAISRLQGHGSRSGDADRRQRGNRARHGRASSASASFAPKSFRPTRPPKLSHLKTRRRTGRHGR